MKKIITLLAILVFVTNLIAQIPERMSYQAVIRNSNNDLLTNKNVGIKISIVSGSANGTVVYSERHPVTTNSNGLATLEIGGGTTISGNFSNINWGTGIYYVRMEVDPSGGLNYSITGESRLLAVPYAFFAAKTVNQFSGSFHDLTNRQNVVEHTGTAGNGDIVYRKGQNWELLKPGTNGQTLRLTNGVPAWSEPGYALAILTTLQVTEIRHTSAISGGFIINKGFTEVTQTGVCWSTNQNPTISDSKTTLGAFTSGSFETTMTGLLPNTKYNVRAYATNGAGTTYGNQVTFTTSPTAVVFPTVATNPVINISQNTAVSGGNISSTGGADIVARGVCWSVNQNPTINDSKTIDGDGTGFYYSQLTGLQGGTKYYICAYATNSAGTGYGPIISFSTSKVLPIVTTKAITDIGPISAASGGVISHNGGGTISDKGICWSDTPNPTLDNQKISGGSGQSAYTGSMRILRPNTTYFVRAYAINEIGTSYGSEFTFTTADGQYEGFEDGFSGSFGGWGIIDTGAIEGTYCLYVNAKNSTVSMTKTSTTSGNIYFYSKLVDYKYGNSNYIKFYIDNQLKSEYKNDFWGLQGIAISPGTHTYKWEYSHNNDGLEKGGFIDCIVVPK